MAINVLLVGRDDLLLAEIEAVLSGAGYRVATAGSGDRALDAAWSGQPDVVFVDGSGADPDIARLLEGLRGLGARIVLRPGPATAELAACIEAAAGDPGMARARPEAPLWFGKQAGLGEILAALGDGVSVQDPDFRIVYQNDVLKKRFGDRVGEHCYRVYEGNAAVCDGCPGALALEDGLAHTALRRVTMPSGVMFFENTASPVRDEAGRIIGFSEVARDATERVAAEEDLRRRHDVQMVMRALAALTLQQQSLEEMLTQAIAQILAIPWLAFESRGAIFLVDDRRGVLLLTAAHNMDLAVKEACSVVPMGRCLCGRAALSGEVQFADRVDERHEIRYESMRPHGHYCVPIKSAAGVLGVLNLYIREGHDRSSVEEDFLVTAAVALAGIIEHGRFEKLLLAERDALRDILSAMEEGVVAVTEDRQVEYVNPTAERLFGPVGGRPCYQYLHDRSEPCPWCRNQEVFAGQTVRREMTLPKLGRTYDLFDIPLRRADGRPRKLEIMRDVTEYKLLQDELRQGAERLHTAMEGVIGAMGMALEKRDPYTAGHQARVARLAEAIAGEMGLAGDRVEGLRLAAAVHDIGKIDVPAEILSRPGRLREAEMALVRVHPRAGYDILKLVDFPWPIATIVLQHHERMDGSGYPDGLAGDQILLEARILAVADTVEAMASHRPYRPAVGVDRGLEELSAGRGTRYDPDVVDACLRLWAERGYTLPEA